MRAFRLVLLGAIALAVCVASPAFAQGNQGNSDNGVGFGIEGGMTRASIHGGDVADLDSRNGLMGGIWFGGNRNGRLGFMGEITYVVKGADEGSSELKLHYLEIPAVFRLNIGQRSRNGISLYGIAGPVIDIQLKGELDGVDVKDQFNGFDLGILAGGGIEVARLGFEVRGNWGQRSLAKKGEGFSDLVDSKNFMVQVLAKLRFN